MAGLFVVGDGWRASGTGATAGVLAMEGVANPERSASLEERAAATERELRARYLVEGLEGLRTTEPFAAYRAYYKGFGKTYHVEGQVASVALKGKAIPRRAALVEAMFIAELEDGMLTAGHDLDAVVPPVRVDVGTGEERYVGIGGGEVAVKAGDLMMVDGEGVISSVIGGPDGRTRIGPGTTRALFGSYGVPGVGAEAVRRHLERIAENVLVVAPGARVMEMAVVGGG